MRKGLKVFGCLVALLAIGGAVFYGPTLWDFYKAGLFERPLEPTVYEGDTRSNLEALHRALMATHDSDGAFPKASEWMEAIKPRMSTSGEKQWELKYVSPALRGKDGQYGYALNEEVSGRYVDDITDPKTTLLVFDSRDASWNAHGDPKDLLPDPPRPGGNLGVTVSGQVVRIEKDGKLTPLP